MLEDWEIYICEMSTNSVTKILETMRTCQAGRYLPAIPLHTHNSLGARIWARKLWNALSLAMTMFREGKLCAKVFAHNVLVHTCITYQGDIMTNIYNFLNYHHPVDLQSSQCSMLRVKINCSHLTFNIVTLEKTWTHWLTLNQKRISFASSGLPEYRMVNTFPWTTRSGIYQHVWNRQWFWIILTLRLNFGA